MSEVDALNEVNKIIEAQLAFNRLLALQVLQSSDTECLQIEASFYLNLEEIPSPRPDSFNEEYMKKLRKGLAKMILSDVVGYEKLSNIANAGKELDYLYLRVHSFREVMICGLKQTDYGLIKNIMSSFFSGTLLDSKIKKIRNEISNLRLKSPIMTDIDMLKEILQILKPKISSYCERFVGESQVEVEVEGEGMFIVLKEEVIRNRRRINEKVSTLRKNNSQDQELISLSEQYFDAVRNTCPNQISNDSDTEYLNFFDRFKKEYQHEEQLRRKMAELSRPPVKTFPQSPIARSKEKPPLKSVKQRTEQETVPPAVNTIMPPEILPTPSMACIDPKIPTLVVEQKSLHFVPLLVANQYNETLSTTPLNEGLVAPRPKNSPTPTPELVTTTEEKEVAEDYSYPLFNKPKTVAPKNVVSDHKLRFAEAYPDFGNEEEKTFLKVFGLMEYTSISLRGLLNLILALKGTITPTGANRCRMEIKNIYAYVLMTEQTLQDLFSVSCQKATVTMHGGGHRKNRSQNHDRGEAPSYLINQFQSAFKRAGFTPENLGLDAARCHEKRMI